MKLLTRIVFLFVCLLIIYILWKNEKPPRKLTKKCLNQNLKFHLLTVSFEYPYYKNIEMFRKMYQDIFGAVLICGPEADATSGRYKPDLELLQEHQENARYHCLALAIQEEPGFSGYFFIKDDVLLNYWNLNGDLSRLWYYEYPPPMKKELFNIGRENPGVLQEVLNRCSLYKDALIRLKQFKNKDYNGNHGMQMYTSNGNSTMICENGPTNFFYIPSKFASSFSLLSKVTSMNSVRENTALPCIMKTLDLVNNINMVSVKFVRNHKYDLKSSNLFWYTYTDEMLIHFPMHINTKDDDVKKYNLEKIIDLFIPQKKMVTKC